MGQMFHPDSKLNKILSMAASFIALNLLWVFCCVPVVTIGAASSAMYTVTRKLARREYPSVVQEFFRAFRANLRQGTLLTLILLLPMALVLVYLLLSTFGEIAGIGGLKALCWIAIFIISLVCSYVWPIQAWFENSLRGTLKNAMLLPLGNPIVAVLVTTLNLVPLFLFTRSAEVFLRISFFWLFAGFALTAFVNTQLLRFQLRQFLPEDEFVKPERTPEPPSEEDEDE